MEKFIKTALEPFKEVLIITCKNISDERGCFSEYFNQSAFQKVSGNATTFVQDNFSLSRKWVLRGLHFQKKPFAQAKLIRVLRGGIFDVVVDLRKKEKTFGKWAGVILNEVDPARAARGENWQVFIFGHPVDNLIGFFHHG